VSRLKIGAVNDAHLHDRIVALTDGDAADDVRRLRHIHLAEVLRNQIPAETEAHRDDLRCRVLFDEAANHRRIVVRVTCVEGREKLAFIDFFSLLCLRLKI
jgi:hypothetical protein